MMRYYRTANWVRLLPEAVNLINSQPMDRNGGIPPNQINSFFDDVKLREARLQHHVNFPEPNRKSEKEEEEINQSSNSDLKIGAYVYLEKEAKTFQKSFELKVSFDANSGLQMQTVRLYEVKMRRIVPTYVFCSFRERAVRLYEVKMVHFVPTNVFCSFRERAVRLYEVKMVHFVPTNVFSSFRERAVSLSVVRKQPFAAMHSSPVPSTLFYNLPQAIQLSARTKSRFLLHFSTT